MAKNSEPCHKVKLWPVEAAVWRNDPTGDRKTPNYSVTIGRNYKQDDEYKTSGTFFDDDLLKVAEAARAAFHWIVRQQEKDHQAVSGNE